MLINETHGSPPTLSDEVEQMLDDLNEFPAACHEALWTANCFAQMALNRSALGRYSVVRQDLTTVAVTVITEWHRIFNPKPVPEIATITGYTPSTLYQLRREGHIPQRERDGSAVIALADIMRYRATRATSERRSAGNSDTRASSRHPAQGEDYVTQRQNAARQKFLTNRK